MLICELEPPGELAWLSVAACDDDCVDVGLLVEDCVDESVAPLEGVSVGDGDVDPEGVAPELGDKVSDDVVACDPLRVGELVTLWLDVGSLLGDCVDVEVCDTGEEAVCDPAALLVEDAELT